MFCFVCINGIRNHNVLLDMMLANGIRDCHIHNPCSGQIQVLKIWDLNLGQARCSSYSISNSISNKIKYDMIRMIQPI